MASVKQKRKKSVAKKTIDIDQTEIDELIQRAENGSLQKKDIECIKAMAECIVFLSQAVDEKARTIKRMVRMVFGAKTEKKENIFDKKDDKNSSDEQDPDKKDDQNSSDKQGPGKKETPPKKSKGNKKGHGRNGAKDYPGAKRIEVPHPDLKAGDPCPKCKDDSKLYKLSKFGVEIRIKGATPIQADIYELEKLRCNTCGKIFTAPMPKTTVKKKYCSSAVSMVALLKYGNGFPFYRLDNLQGNLGVPLPSSTQWDIINKTAWVPKPAYEKLIELAAQGEVLHNDDTGVKILELIKQNKEESPARKGMFTTGIVSINQERKIVLFLSGRNHAGENLDGVLGHRDKSLPTPIQMCDALNRNIPSTFATILAYCLIHARRNFIDASANFPEECQFVIDTLAEVYRFDAKAKEQEMTPEQRLHYHQENSGPLMDGLKLWLDEQIDEKKVESNSGLGEAIEYMRKHWEKLTVFLRVAGAPLDNNICERALKKAILHRKNSCIFKTTRGAEIGDMYMSLIYTCELASANPFEYLQALHDHPEQVKESPASWMPWNYTANLAQHKDPVNQ